MLLFPPSLLQRRLWHVSIGARVRALAILHIWTLKFAMEEVRILPTLSIADCTRILTFDKGTSVFCINLTLFYLFCDAGYATLSC